MVKQLIGTFFLMVLCACATSTAIDIAGLRSALNTAEIAADQYIRLPLCGQEQAGQLCSKITVIKQIKTSVDAAETAYAAAEKAQSQSAIGVAQTAITAVQNIISTVQNGSN